MARPNDLLELVPASVPRVPTDDEARQLLRVIPTLTDEGARTAGKTRLQNYMADAEARGRQPFAPAPVDVDAFLPFYGGLDTLPALDKAAFGANTADVNAEGVNRALAAKFFPDQDLDANWPGYRQGLGKALTGLEKSDWTDASLYSAIGGKLKEREADQKEMRSLAEKMSAGAMEGKSFVDLWLSGTPNAPKKGADAIDRSNPKADERRAFAQRIYDQTVSMRDNLRPMADMLRLHLDGASGGAGFDFNEMVDAVRAVPEEQRGILYLQIMQQMQGPAWGRTAKPEQAGVVAEAGQSIIKGFRNTLRSHAAFLFDELANAERLARGENLTYPTGEGTFATIEAPTTPEGLAEARANYADLKERADVVRQLQDFADEMTDPKGHGFFTKKILNPALEQVGYMAQAAVPYAGIPLLISSTAGMRQEEARARGMSPTESRALGIVSGTIEAPIERLSLGLAFRPLKAGAGNLIGRLAARFAEQTVEQNLQEAVQDATPLLIQEAMQRTGLTDAGVTAKDWKAYGSERIDTFWALLPLVAVGTGAASFRDAEAGRSYTRRELLLRAVGFTPEAVQAIQSAPTPEAAQEALKAAWNDPEQRKTGTEEQRAAIAEIDAQNEATAEQSGPATPDAPREATIELQEDGSYAVVDADGEWVDITSTEEAALDLKARVDEAQNATQQQAIDEQIAFLQQRSEPGETTEKAGELTVQDRVAADEMTQQEANALVQEYVRMGRLEKGATPKNVLVTGESTKPVFDATAQLWRNVNRIRAGANPLVVIEEGAETYLKRRFADGTVALGDVLRWREQVEGGKVEEADQQERALIEWFSGYAQAYVSGKADLDPSLPLSLRYWLRQFKKVVAATLTLARKVMDMESRGTLPEDFRTHLRRSARMDATPADAQRAANEQAQGTLGDTFSLAQTETPEFKAWFGASKVVDAEGKPMVVYRGQDGGWTRASENIPAGGIHFSSEAEYARSYGEKTDTFIKMENPLDLRGAKTRAQVESAFAKAGVPLATKVELYPFAQEAAGEYRGSKSLAQWFDLLEKEGRFGDTFSPNEDITDHLGEAVKKYVDGMMFDEHGKPGLTSYVVFEPEQIKSATGNRGTFDPNNPDITFSLTGRDIQAAHDEAMQWKRVNTGDTIGGLEVRDRVPNVASISAGFTHYKTIGVREVPMTALGADPTAEAVAALGKNATTRKLADDIKASGELNPLIIAVNGKQEGQDGIAYVLEGAHRIDALELLGAKSFPALVVIDQDDITFALASREQVEQEKTIWRERRVAERIRTAEHKGDAFDAALRAELDANRREYAVEGQTGVLEAAAERIRQDPAAAYLAVTTQDASVPPKERVAMGVLLARAYSNAGRLEELSNVVDGLAESGTEAGRTVALFAKLGVGFDTIEKVLFYRSKKAKAMQTEKDRLQPEIAEAEKLLPDINAEAEKLLVQYLGRLFSAPAKPDRNAAPIAANPYEGLTVTFSLAELSDEQRKSGIIERTADIMERQGPAAAADALRVAYGEKVEKFVPVILIDAARLLLEKAGKGDGKAGKQAGEAVDVLPADAQAELRRRLVDAWVKRLKAARNVETPGAVVRAITKLAEKQFRQNSGPLTAEEFRAAFDKKFTVPALTDEMREKLARMAEALRTTPENSNERARATEDIMREIHESLDAPDWVDVGFGLAFANMLAGVATHARNIFDNTGRFFLRIATDVAADPRNAGTRLAEELTGALSGAREGTAEAKRIVRTGEASYFRTTPELHRAGGALETVKGTNPYTKAVGSMKYIARLLRAQDLFAYATTYEAFARRIALQMAQTRLGAEATPESLKAEATRILNLTDEQQADLTGRARQEWAALHPDLKAKTTEAEWTQRRVRELTYFSRDGELVMRAGDIAERATLNYTPEGYLGVLANYLEAGFKGLEKGAATSGNRGIKAIGRLPRIFTAAFIRVPTNAVNQGLELTPFGLVTLASGKTLKWEGPFKHPRYEALTADQMDALRVRALLGNAMLAIIGAVFYPNDDDDKLIKIHGAGGGNRAQTLAHNGPKWQRWSIQIGDTFLPYWFSPLAIPLMAIGAIHDLKRYGKHDDEEAMNYAAVAAKAAVSAYLSQTFLRNTGDLLDSLTGPGSASPARMVQNVSRAIGTLAVNASVPWIGSVRSVSNLLDPSKREARSTSAVLRSTVGVGFLNGQQIDTLGDDITNRPWDWFITANAAGEPEARIYAAFAAANAYPSGLDYYRTRMEPEQYEQFQRVRGGTIKRLLLEDGEARLAQLRSLKGEDAKAYVRAIARDATQAARGAVGYVPPRPGESADE